MRQLIDPFGRNIKYLRVSLTDRCDFRCIYCMSEQMTFLPKKEMLTLEELERICNVFIKCGVHKIRLTGGEPLVRRNAMHLIKNLSLYLKDNIQDSNQPALEELTITTNGSQLAKFADDLANYGIKRINVSLDTLDHKKFIEITRWGRIEQVLEGLEACKKADIKIKINCVALKHVNIMEADHLLKWCIENQYDLTFIEVMPMGKDENMSRVDQYWPLSQLRADLSKNWTMQPSAYRTGGPARYFELVDYP
ncbi:MAG: radical SAM protein, partial [Pseudomonadota bacterium]